jgi:glycosyltransferase involved in cell wall biosynthesis
MYAKNFFTFRYGYGDRFKFIKKYLYHSLDTLVVLTTDSANWLKENNILTNVAIIPNPIVYPLAVSHPIIATNKLIKPKLKTILAVGRLVKIKGFDLLINSFAKIASKYSHWQLVIIGEGPQRLALEQQIFKLSLQQQVKLPGVAGNLHDWYQAVDLFVLSSRNEGLSCVLIEAMAYGLPVVSFNCKSGPSDIIKHEVNGLLVESENTIALSQALIRLIENKSLCHKLSESAIAVRDKYSIENIAQQWLNLFSYLSCKH